MAALTGSVKIQAQTICSARTHFSALKRLAAPTPMMDMVMTCVVETGIPSIAVPSNTLAPAVSAAKPWTGWSFTSLWPSVRMMRQPPMAVPAAIVSAQIIFIQRGIASFLTHDLNALSAFL